MAIRIDQGTYLHAKEACYICLKGGPLVDTEVNIEGEGALAICDTCTLDLAQVHGLVVTRPKAPKSAK